MNCCDADGDMERLELSAMPATWLYNNVAPLEGGVAIVSRVRVFPVDDVAVIIVKPAVCGVIVVVVVPLVVVVVAVATEGTLDDIATFVYVFDTVNAGVVV